MIIPKPMLACDADFSKIEYPCIAMPKIDGVRAMRFNGKLTGRSFKKFRNKHVHALFNHDTYEGLDGEMVVAGGDTDALCRDTVSALNSYEGEPNYYWAVFDLINEQTIKKSYYDRLCILHEQASTFENERIYPVPYHVVESENDLLALEQQWLDSEYEGVIVRAVHGHYKFGRSTAREGLYLRIKRFIEEDAVVTEVIEGQTNNNEATTNELGHTERSSHAENMVPNGMVGALICRDVKTGAEIRVSPGKMTHAERIAMLADPALIVGKTIKYKHFMIGRKDKPRMPTFQSIRLEVDQTED